MCVGGIAQSQLLPVGSGGIATPVKGNGPPLVTVHSSSNPAHCSLDSNLGINEKGNLTFLVPGSK